MSYGHREKGNCSDIELLVPPGAGTSQQIIDAAAAISPKGKTPISDAVRQAAEALGFTEARPGVRVPGGHQGGRTSPPSRSRLGPPRSALVRMNPKWSAVDVDIELATLRDWDKRTILGFLDTRPLVPPMRLVAPSLVVLAEKSLLITERVAAQLRRQGMTVETVEGTGHTVFRDDHVGFMDTVVAWLRAVVPSTSRLRRPSQPDDAARRSEVTARPQRRASGASPLSGSDRAQHRDDLAEHLGVVAEDRLERRVAGEQPGVAVALAEHLHGGLAVEHRRDDLAVLGVVLLRARRPSRRRRSRRRSSTRRRP